MGLSLTPGQQGPTSFNMGTLFKDQAFKESPFRVLPKDVLLSIFSKLGANDLDSIRLVCRSFNKIGDDILKIAARQLNIPLRKNEKGEVIDDAKAIKALFKLYEKSSFSDFYEIIPGNPPTIEAIDAIDQKDLVSLQNQINVLKNKYPNHPYLSMLEQRIPLPHSQPPVILNFNCIAMNAMKKFPNGSWTSANGYYVYKDSNSKVILYNSNASENREIPPELQKIIDDKSKEVVFLDVWSPLLNPSRGPPGPPPVPPPGQPPGPPPADLEDEDL